MPDTPPPYITAICDALNEAKHAGDEPTIPPMGDGISDLYFDEWMITQYYVRTSKTKMINGTITTPGHWSDWFVTHR